MPLDERICYICSGKVPEGKGERVRGVLAHQGACYEDLKDVRSDLFPVNWASLRREAIELLASIKLPAEVMFQAEWMPPKKLVELAIYHRDGGYKCHICGRPLIVDPRLRRPFFTKDDFLKKPPEFTYHVHHVNPRSFGGPDTLGNLKFSHSRCNISYGGRNRPRRKE
jgi:hypothetical protein